ncbi:MAG: DUF349 domain-containing protein [Saccharospirillum sp.]
MVVLSKLFSRSNKKKDAATQAPAKKAVEIKPQAHKPTLDDLVRRSQSDDRREQHNALMALSSALSEGEISAEALAGLSLPEVQRMALFIQHSGNPGEAKPTPDQWLQLALHGFTAQVRTYAAEHLTDPAAVEQLLKASKGRDKAVYRIAKDKQESLRAERKRLEDQEQRVNELVNAMARHATATLDPLYAGKLKNLSEQWQVMQAEATDEQRAAFNTAFEQAQTRLDEQSALINEAEERHQAVAMADTERQSIVDRVLTELRARVDHADIQEQDLREAQLFLTEQQHLWRESEQHSKPSKEEERSFHRLCTAFEASLSKQHDIHQRYGSVDSLLERLENTPDKMDAEAQALDEWVHHLDWPDDVEAPAMIARVEKALARHHDQLAEHRQHEIHQVRQARGLMRRCMAAVNDGHLKRASGLLLGCSDALEGLPEKQHPGLYRQFEETREAVEKLRDWQSFAVLPKKEVLIERMRHLVDQPMPPEARAAAIRAMQDEWRQLSRGLQNQHQELWETFHELAQTAYEPCREFFAEQSKLRSLNLEKRQELVEQLKQYESLTDWSAPDLKEVDRVLNMARQDWRRFSPVDRAANKAVQQAFDEVYQRIRGHLQQEQSQFKQAKQAIIEKARALLAVEDSRQATEAAKKLQKEWQQAGHLARRDEQALWKEFRAICDQLFERRGQQIEAFKADLEAHKQTAERLTAELTALAQSDDPVAEKDAADQIRHAFRELGTLPKAQHKALVEQFDKASRAFDARCRAEQARARDRHWQAVFNWVRWARFEADSAEAARAAFNDLTPPAPARHLADHLDALRQAEEPGQKQALRRKTIELEALAGIDSPEADKALRMELQVQRLAEGMGQKVTREDVEQAVIDWLLTPGVPADCYDEMAQRMQLARTAWLKEHPKT